MAVIAEKTVGNILYQEANAAPTHSAASGSFCIVNGDGTSQYYINYDGSTGWSRLTPSIYGGMYVQDNTTSSNLAPTPTNWAEITNLTFTAHKNKLVTLDAAPNAYRLVLNSSNFASGVYEVSFLGTVTKDATGASGLGYYDIGVSVNGATPSDGLWSGCSVSDVSLKTYDVITITNYATLNPGDKLSCAVRRRAGSVALSTAVILRNGYLFARRYR